ncbi:hypothetical protein AB0L71_28920 [Streptomyces sp. NPDC052052]|uniref:hypothetical protein n=1 Tax=Streptomyces sp. NPDC052052 TaxID=3154756 RepID=UPI0034144C79
MRDPIRVAGGSAVGGGVRTGGGKVGVSVVGGTMLLNFLRFKTGSAVVRPCARICAQGRSYTRSHPLTAV